MQDVKVRPFGMVGRRSNRRRSNRRGTAAVASSVKGGFNTRVRVRNLLGNHAGFRAGFGPSSRGAPKGAFPTLHTTRAPSILWTHRKVRSPRCACKGRFPMLRIERVIPHAAHAKLYK